MQLAKMPNSLRTFSRYSTNIEVLGWKIRRCMDAWKERHQHAIHVGNSPMAASIFNILHTSKIANSLFMGFLKCHPSERASGRGRLLLDDYALQGHCLAISYPRVARIVDASCGMSGV